MSLSSRLTHSPTNNMDWTLVNTRPAQQASQLQKQLNAQHINNFFCPLIEITPLSLTAEQHKELQKQQNDCWHIFTSHYSADFALQTYRQIHNAIAIGNTTAETLRLHGVPNIVTAPAPHTSETLLTLPQLRDSQDNPQNWVLWRCKEGRKKLLCELEKRFQSLITLDIYTQNPLTPQQTEKKTIHKLSNPVWLASSLSILRQIHTHFPEAKKHPIISISTRISQYANSLGWTTIWQTETPSNTSIIRTIQKKRRL